VYIVQQLPARTFVLYVIPKSHKAWRRAVSLKIGIAVNYARHQDAGQNGHDGEMEFSIGIYCRRQCCSVELRTVNRPNAIQLHTELLYQCLKQSTPWEPRLNASKAPAILNHPGRAPCKTTPERPCCILYNMGSLHII